MSRKRSLSYRKGCLSLFLALSVSAAPVLAAPPPSAAPAVPAPNAGTIQNSLEDQKISAPIRSKVDIEVSREEPPAPTEQGPKVKISGFRITGQKLVPEAELQKLVKDAAGSEVSLGQLQTVAQRIADYLHRQGYLVASAYIPVQDVADGVVEIAVVPGQYGTIDIQNHSSLSPALVAGLLSGLKAGDYVKKDRLERGLLLLSDIGGISVKATLAPGGSPGTTDLRVELHDNEEDATGTFSLDNYGNRYTGQAVGNVTLAINNASGIGDVVNLGNNYSGTGMNNFSFGYNGLIGSQGFRLGFKYANMHYALGKEFTGLSSGKSGTVGIFGDYPLVRSRNRNVSAQLQFEYRNMTDNLYAGYDYQIEHSEKHARVWSLGLNGDSRHPAGADAYALTFSFGQLDFDSGWTLFSGTPKDEDDRYAHTAGSYTKVNLDFNHWQNFNPRLNFLLKLSGQWAGKNLDSSEKLYLGGARGVRAYPQGEAAGDQGYLASGELRWDLPEPSLQLAAFVDTGRITINKNPWPYAGDNGRALSGAGVSVIASGDKDYTVRLDYAWRLGSEHVASETKDSQGRWWLYAIQYF